MQALNKGRAFAVDVKDVTSEGQIAGYGSVFGNVDQGFDIVEPGSFDKSLETRGMPKMLFGHDMWEPPIGKWTKAGEDKDGLALEGSLNMDTQRGSEIHAGLKMGTLDGLSIGFLLKDSEVDKRGIRHIKEVDLFEVSVVTFPMNELARVDAVKQLVDDGISKRTLERILRDAGFTGAQAKALIAEGYNGIAPRDGLCEQEKEAEVVRDTLRSLFK